MDWDRSLDWQLYRVHNHLWRVVVRFRTTPASVRELMALRRCLPPFRDTPATTLRSVVGDGPTLSLGDIPGLEARPLVEKLRAEGLEVLAEDVSFTKYLPFDRTSGCGWLIEDESESAAICHEMLAAGVPVVDVECD